MLPESRLTTALDQDFRPLAARLEAFKGLTLAWAAAAAFICVEKLHTPMDHLAVGMG